MDAYLLQCCSRLWIGALLRQLPGRNPAHLHARVRQCQGGDRADEINRDCYRHKLTRDTLERMERRPAHTGRRIVEQHPERGAATLIGPLIERLGGAARSAPATLRRWAYR